MWNLKKQNKQNKLVDIEKRLVFTREEGSGEKWMKWVKGINCMVMDGNQTCGGDHFVVYTGVKL